MSIEGFEHVVPDGSEKEKDFSIEEIEQKHTEVLQQLEEVLDSEEGEEEGSLEKFIEKRISELEDSSEKGTISLISGHEYSGFIHPETGVYRTMMCEPNHIDDREIYTTLTDRFQEFRKIEGFKDASMRQLELLSVQYALSNYFGNALGGDDVTSRNMAFYNERSIMSDEPLENISIADMKGEGIAVCIEKAAVAQNLMSFLGRNSRLVLSNKCKIDTGGDEEAHAFNVIRSEKGTFIYDPANPSVQITKEEGEARSMSVAPALYKLTEEQLEAFNQGKPVEVQHVDGERDGMDSEWIRKTSTRVYSK